MADHWAICPFVNGPELTEQATRDLLAQTLPVRVLLVGQGASEEVSSRLREFAEQHHPQVLLWSYNPALPSLSAVWNRALAYVWELGGEEALVVNNDVRLHKETHGVLLEVLRHQQALFVSAVGVVESQFDPRADHQVGDFTTSQVQDHGGPDFSCFLISRKGHERYPFDERFIPAFCEDLDAHRRYMLGGDGDKIFSVNLPYLHYASQTIKAYSPEERHRFNQGFAACKAYYKAKWGGGVNEETFRTPFGEGDKYMLAEDGRVHLTVPSLSAPRENLKHWGSREFLSLPVTTPDLQRYWQVNRRPTDAPDVP